MTELIYTFHYVVVSPDTPTPHTDLACPRPPPPPHQTARRTGEIKTTSHRQNLLTRTVPLPTHQRRTIQVRLQVLLQRGRFQQHLRSRSTGILQRRHEERPHRGLTHQWQIPTLRMDAAFLETRPQRPKLCIRQPERHRERTVQTSPW